MNNKTKIFKVDARTILQLGRDSIKSHTTALAELVKNSYDADAKLVEVEIHCKDKNPDNHYIRVADNGFGMTEDIIDDNWLRIGFSDKKKKKHSQNGRRKTGEKGIGRIAADRLGAQLTILSKAEKDSVQGLTINWDDFDVDNRNLSDIKVNVISNPHIKIPKNSANGTEIIIKNLRQQWSEEDIEDLHGELSTLVSPFDDLNEFEIHLKTDVTDALSDLKIKSAFLDAAEVAIEVEYDGVQQELTYYIDDRKHNHTDLEKIKVENILQHDKPPKERLTLKCGPFKLKVFFFVRDSSILDRTSFSKLQDFKDTLDQYVGIKIYRDFIAVKPYGFPKTTFGDWLSLAERKAKDPAGVSRSTYKVTPNQIAGGVFITRDDNPDLHDSASREGLVENEGYFDLKMAVFRAIEVLEAHRHRMSENSKNNVSSTQNIPDSAKRPIRKSKADRIHNIKDTISGLGESIRDIGKKITDPTHSSYELSTKLEKTADAIQTQTTEFINVVDELLGENRVLNGLATLGISTAVFGHETQTAISLVKQASHNVKSYLSLRSPKIEEALQENEKVIRGSKLVAGWGSFALTRINTEKRKNPKHQEIHLIIQNAINEIKPAFESSSTMIHYDYDKVISKVYPMDVETIVFNLLTNAFQACKQVSTQRIVRVNLIAANNSNSKGFEISVADSGHGIAKEFIHKIWEPLFTTRIEGKKSSGTGLGLTIVESVVNELNGEIKVEATHKELGGAKFTIWLPKTD